MLEAWKKSRQPSTSNWPLHGAPRFIVVFTKPISQRKLAAVTQHALYWHNRTSLLNVFKTKTTREIRHNRESDELSSCPGDVRIGGGRSRGSVPAKSIHDNQSPEDPTRPYTATARHNTSEFTAPSELKHTIHHQHQCVQISTAIEYLHHLLASLFPSMKL